MDYMEYQDDYTDVSHDYDYEREQEQRYYRGEDFEHE